MKYSKQVKYFSLLAVIALLFATCTKEEDPELVMKDSITQTLNKDINADSIEAFVTWMEDFGTRYALADNRLSVAVKIKNRFIQMGYTNTIIDTFNISRTDGSGNYPSKEYNVIATLEGTDISDSISVIGGHYDNTLTSGNRYTTVPGANDNASGVAATLEIARVMKKNNYSPESSIVFVAFGSEELGLNGSNWYASDSRSTLKKIRMMLNNDMIAYEPDNNSATWYVNIIDYNNSHFLRSEAENLCSKYTLLKHFNNNTYSNASDSYPFFNYGYKALFFFSGKMDPNYHTLDDLAANCNFNYCREIVKLNCAMLVYKN